MALDGLLLHALCRQFQEILPCKINKIHQISNTELLFHLRTQREKKNLLISCHSQYNRINLTDRAYPTPEEPSHFVMLLRKHLEGGLILSIEQGGLDRWLVMEVSLRNEIGDKVFRKLYVELMGKYANVILVDENNRILDALKRIPPFENTKRTIQPGAQFTLPEQAPKQNPFTALTVDFQQPLHQQFDGFSPLLGREVEARMHRGETFAEIMKQLENSDSLFITNTPKETQFHLIPLTQFEQPAKAYPLMEGMDVLYYHKEEKDRIRQMTGDLFKFVRKQLKHYRQKLPKLNDALQEALDCEKWREYGDLLYAYGQNIAKGTPSVTLNTFDQSQQVKIDLDVRFDGRGNAKKCFQKYNKGKKGQEHLLEQIALCEQEIEYFEGLEQQLELANFEDAREIREELAALGYMKPIQSKIRRNRKKAKALPAITTIHLADGVTLYFGKNNLQNEALTFKLARKNDLWFHAKDFHGSHVVLDCEQPSEETLRCAAMVAAYYSKGRYSSSVPVNYCPIRNLKRVPGAKPGFVSLTSYKTIYIDPEEAVMDSLLKENQ
ncbi:Rqc2 family fibronectin-binding protein [Holdemania massiliensis]|uniref:Rqc2 family fibronectin-binding protein n=1 Tax=Holdemania massiliensis TaxID=1468449 RepID=UPI001F06C95A|nr:NFACT RNA binding domain-containing protein [Holdemania massiliensis]MCH1940685.1 NFACT family protein [Holdemania massiliensis]